jgi:hypothetical protein
MKQKIRNGWKVLLAFFALNSSFFLFTSCNDFLSIVPLNDIVLENYWTEEADVNSVVNSCYAQLETQDCLKRMLVWGEVRSDNFTNGTGTGNDLNQIIKENILETNSFTTWQCFYQCINRCNTVIHYAPGVHAIDPNYTEAEMKAHIAEVSALRDLCYFYLIRAFRDVPYSTQPSIDDTKDFMLPATKFDVVLDSLIADLESVKQDAVRSYGEESVENKCRITRWGIYAMLADMYLWKGEYQKTIDYCDLIIDEKIREYEEDYEEDPTGMTVELYGKYPLISEAPNNSTYAGNAYDEIFGEGNSFESIFELNFVQNQSTTNGLVADFFGGSRNSAGQLSAPSYLFTDAYAGLNDYFSKTDSRYLEYMSESNSRILVKKYVNESVRFRSTTTTGGMPVVTSSTRSQDYANWIVYRFTDVILMRAEAEVELAGNMEKGASASEEQLDRYRRAFAGVSAVWRRANLKRVATTDTLVFDDYASSRMDMENLVFDERQRELMFEGKRWFDLVRMCRRDGENNRMIQKVSPKFVDNTAAIKIRLAIKDYLYFPYNRSELKANPLLQQNPAYETDKTSLNM